MVYGAAAAGKYAMTASSSPGISLMQEALSYMAGAEVPGYLWMLYAAVQDWVIFRLLRAITSN